MTGPAAAGDGPRRPVIGLLGAYGAAGSHTGPLLRGWDAGDLRVGGRDRGRCAATAAALGATAVPVDATDPASVAAFAQGCDVVVNCAGPSRELSAAVAAAASEAGADLVDAGGDAALRRSLTAGPGRRVLLGAGGLPGLSGLLPRRAAVGFDDPLRTLTAWFAARDTFTVAAAVDFLDGVLGPSTAAPTGAPGRSSVMPTGAAGAPAAAAREDVELPFVPGPVTLLPHLDDEGEAVVADLRLASAEFCTAVGPGLGAALERVRGQDRDAAVRSVRRAAALDAAGRSPSAVFLVELAGSGPDRTRTAVLRAPGISALTGAAAAATTLAVLRGEVPAGVHTAASVLDPVVTLDRLADAGALTLALHPCGLDALAVVEEGAL